MHHEDILHEIIAGSVGDVFSPRRYIAIWRGTFYGFSRQRRYSLIHIFIFGNLWEIQRFIDISGAIVRATAG